MVQAESRAQAVLILRQRKYGQGIHRVGILPGRHLFESQPPLERPDERATVLGPREKKTLMLLQCFQGGMAIVY